MAKRQSKQGMAVLYDARFQASITSTVHRVDQILCKVKSTGRLVILLEL